MNGTRSSANWATSLGTQKVEGLDAQDSSTHEGDSQTSGDGDTDDEVHHGSCGTDGEAPDVSDGCTGNRRALSSTATPCSVGRHRRPTHFYIGEPQRICSQEAVSDDSHHGVKVHSDLAATEDITNARCENDASHEQANLHAAILDRASSCHGDDRSPDAVIGNYACLERRVGYGWQGDGQDAADLDAECAHHMLSTEEGDTKEYTPITRAMHELPGPARAQEMITGANQNCTHKLLTMPSDPGEHVDNRDGPRTEKQCMHQSRQAGSTTGEAKTKATQTDLQLDRHEAKQTPDSGQELARTRGVENSKKSIKKQCTHRSLQVLTNPMTCRPGQQLARTRGVDNSSRITSKNDLNTDGDRETENRRNSATARETENRRNSATARETENRRNSATARETESVEIRRPPLSAHRSSIWGASLWRAPQVLKVMMKSTIRITEIRQALRVSIWGASLWRAPQVLKEMHAAKLTPAEHRKRNPT